ncbi:shK domain-like domain-containing protein [Ditylenchus destructor]|nr:shK domain-like domain-containing protein [Ditylenchus destructor]
MAYTALRVLAYFLLALLTIVHITEAIDNNCEEGGTIVAMFQQTGNDAPCENEVLDSVCTTTFAAVAANPAASPPVAAKTVREVCISHPYAEDVLKCAKTCQMCCRRPEYNCEDNDKPFCTANKDRCQVTAFKEIMADKCGMTCGLCNAGGNINTCRDRSSDCTDSAYKDLCTSSDLTARESVRKMCPKTCQVCVVTSSGASSVLPPSGKPPTDSNCADTNPTDCETNILLCENVAYSQLMSTECRKTCGYCLPSNFSCQDKNKADCDRWNANGFCLGSEYPKGMKLLNCPVTCGLCTP